MSKIKESDVIKSVSDALQFISYYHPIDFIQALGEAYTHEESQQAKDAIAQILMNSRMAAEGHRPICQDTGIVTVFVKVGMDAQWADATMGVSEMINQGVRLAYTSLSNPLRASIVYPPDGERKNTTDNTPAIIHYELVRGDKVEIIIAAKGGGSENKSKFTMLLPNDSIVDWVLSSVESMGAGWCPPGILGIGIGGTSEKSMIMAKESLMDPVDIHDVIRRGPKDWIESLRIELYHKINALGIGAQGLGGLSTVLDVKIMAGATHAASKPVSIIPNCAATRHIAFTLDGSGPAKFTKPSLSDWPDVTWRPNPTDSLSVDLNTLDKEKISHWKAGQQLLLSGKILTGRDAAHKRIVSLIEEGRELPVSFKNRVIYYVGPVDPVGNEILGPAGPTTATRMDKFTPTMLEKTGLLAMIGKAERGSKAIQAIKDNKSAYLTAVGGAAYLISKKVSSATVVAFEDLGMEAIYELEVKDMPVTVAVDSEGVSVHIEGPKYWKNRIAITQLG
ncbi:TPA: fumarate hydratase [Serratia marcescens]|nr:fumarate hydratase [Serratia marcescens]